MRGTGSTAETMVRTGVLAGNDYETSARLLVKNDAGTWVDLSNLYGHDFLVSWRYTEGVDDPIATASFELRREVGRLSLAPMMAGSRVNKSDGTPSGTLTPLLTANREVKLQTSVDAFGATPSNWRTLFHGRVVSFDSAADPLTLTCQDLGGALLRKKLKRVRWYGLAQTNADSGCLTWAPSLAFNVGDRTVPRTSTGATPKSYRCTVAGTTSATEPTWGSHLTLGSTFTDGGVTWEVEADTSQTALTPVEIVMQAILRDAFAGSGVVAPTLVVPTASGWAVRAFEQERDGVLAVLNALAMQRGWMVRYWYDGTDDAFKPTFFEPDRTKSINDATWAADALVELKELSTGIESVRNVIRGIGYDRTSLSAGQQPTRMEIELTNAASVAKYDELFAEISQGTTDQIDSPAELTSLVTKILADLAEPLVSHVAEAPFFPWAQLGDVYGFPADGVHYDTQQNLAVVGIEHTGQAGVARTTLSCRGQPVSANKGWHQLFPGNRQEPPKRPENTYPGGIHVVTATTTPTPGGAAIRIDSQRKNPFAGYEVHVGDSATFTPSAATLLSTAKDASPRIDASGLPPGQPRYLQVIPYEQTPEGVVMGAPPPPVPFTPGYVEGRHILPYLDFRAYPLNGGFESPGLIDAPPDCWDTNVGDFGVDWTVNNVNPFSGSIAAEFKGTAVATEIQSSFVPVSGGASKVLKYALSSIGVPASGRTVTFAVAWLDAEQSGLGASTLTVSLDSVAGGWFEQAQALTAPTGARWARITVTKSAHTDARFYLDAVRIEDPAPSAAPAVVEALATCSTSPLATHAAFTQVPFNTETRDTDGAFTTGSTAHFTAPAAGTYLVTGGVEIQMNTVGTAVDVVASVFVNGSEKARFSRFNGTTGSFNSEEIISAGAAIIRLALGDTVDLRIFQQNTSSVARALTANPTGNYLGIVSISLD